MCVESVSDGNWIYDDEFYVKEVFSILIKEEIKILRKLEGNVVGFYFVKLYEVFVMKKSEEVFNVKRKCYSWSGYLKKRGKGNLIFV